MEAVTGSSDGQPVSVGGGDSLTWAVPVCATSILPKLVVKLVITRVITSD